MKECEDCEGCVVNRVSDEQSELDGWYSMVEEKEHVSAISGVVTSRCNS